LPGPHGCPCAHAVGYGHQTGISFVRLPSSIDPLEHKSQAGIRLAPADTGDRNGNKMSIPAGAWQRFAASLM
jgi:hypothetical protein